MLIRHGKLSDLDSISAIELANFGEAIATTKSAFEERLQIMTDTFLVVDHHNEVVAYIEGPVVAEPNLTDDLFHKVTTNQSSGGYIAVTSLSVSDKVKGQGLGTALIAAMKDLALVQNRQGIVLTCEEYVLPYYKMNGFTDEGTAESKRGGKVWYKMVWKASSPEKPDFITNR